MSLRSRPLFLPQSAIITAASLRASFVSSAHAQAKNMDAMTAILTRRSVRAYTDAPVTEEQITTMLKAAMAAPSARNAQPWEFLVITDKEKLKAISHAPMAQSAPLAILTCVDTTRETPGYGIQDVSAATQNLLLAAHAIGLGAVWTGVYPSKERMTPIRQQFNLPDTITPLALVIIGHPRNQPEKADRYKAERIHTNTW